MLGDSKEQDPLAQAYSVEHCFRGKRKPSQDSKLPASVPCSAQVPAPQPVGSQQQEQQEAHNDEQRPQESTFGHLTDAAPEAVPPARPAS